jgi:hypothetical protein
MARYIPVRAAQASVDAVGGHDAARAGVVEALT